MRDNLAFKTVYPYHRYCFKIVNKFPFIQLIEVDYSLPNLIPLFKKECVNQEQDGESK